LTNVLVQKHTASVLHTNLLILLRKIIVAENLKKNANTLYDHISRIFNVKPGSAHLQYHYTVGGYLVCRLFPTEW